MTINEATQEHLDGIRAVARRSWEADYPGVVSRESVAEGVDDWYARDRLEDALTRSQARLLVSITEGRVVGFAHAVWDGDDGYILRLYVDPAHRRAGIGGRLLERIRADLFEQGADRIIAMVLAANDLGNTFYREAGFEQVAEEETIIGETPYPENTYVLQRTQSSNS